MDKHTYYIRFSKYVNIINRKAQTKTKNKVDAHKFWTRAGIESATAGVDVLGVLDSFRYFR